MRSTAITILLGLGLAAAAAAQSPKAAELYQARCAACHGPDGRAAVPAGKALGARDFSLPAVQEETDAQLAAIIGDGKAKMPAFGKLLSKDQIQDLVAYVRALAKKKGI